MSTPVYRKGDNLSVKLSKGGTLNTKNKAHAAAAAAETDLAEIAEANAKKQVSADQAPEEASDPFRPK